MLDQSLPDDGYEAIFVDDGSTDGTGERLDALAAEHDQLRVEHIPNSGWPGRPRNVGTDLAAGGTSSTSTTTTTSAARRSSACTTAPSRRGRHRRGKVVGHGKSSPRELFAENRSGVTVDWAPLIRLLRRTSSSAGRS